MAVLVENDSVRIVGPMMSGLAERVVELRLELHHALRRERAALRMRDIYRSRLEELDGTSCRACGCTENNACDGGCTWAEEDLCSRCSDERQRRRLRRFLGLRRAYSRTRYGGPQIGWQEA